MHRFFVPAGALDADIVRLEGAIAHQLRRVLRVTVGERIVLLDDTGWACTVLLRQVTARGAIGEIEARWQPQTEPSAQVVVCQALPKGRRFEWVLQKGTELGVTRFVPMHTAHSVVRPSSSEGAARLERWRAIVREAAEQSGRARLPQVQAPVSFEEACAPVGADTRVLSLMPCLCASSRPLREVMEERSQSAWDKVRIFVGPEGDFAPEEVARASATGAHLVSLGPRTLRTETAALVAISAVLYALGELG